MQPSVRIACCGLIMLTACSRPPYTGAVCADVSIQKALTEMIFSAGEHQIDRNVANNLMVDWTAVKANLRSLRADNLFSYSQIVFKGADKETHTVHCGATVSITLPTKYKNEVFEVLASNVHGSQASTELFGDKPEIGIDYTIRPDLASKGGAGGVVSSDNAAPLYDSLFVLAVAKWQITRQHIDTSPFPVR
jgi:hypothetical protein